MVIKMAKSRKRPACQKKPASRETDNFIFVVQTMIDDAVVRQTITENPKEAEKGIKQNLEKAVRECPGKLTYRILKKRLLQNRHGDWEEEDDGEMVGFVEAPEVQ